MSPTVPGPVVPVDDATELTVKAWRFLEQEMQHLGTPLPEPVVPVLEFMKAADAKPTKPEERLAIVHQAELLFDHFYPHMPFKTKLFQFDHPREFLKAARAGVETDSETDFHGWMVAAFSIVRDAHTLYGLPSPYRGATAFLPFQMASIIDTAGERRFVVTRVMSSGESGGFGHQLFGPGAEIVEWTGGDIESHVLRAAGRLPGGNPSAQFARATMACTIRPLTFCHFPFEDEMPAAEIVYRTEPMAKELHAIRLPWGVVRFPQRAAFPSKGFSMNMLSEEFNSGVRALQYREEMWEAQRFKDSDDFTAVSRIPSVFEFQFTGGPRKLHPIQLDNLVDSRRPKLRLGYFRIKSFNDGSDAPGATDRLVKEARRILTLLDEKAPDGLVIDIRGNPGGDLEAAERMLQLLTPGRIAPESFHFANTETIRGAMRGIRSALALKDLPPEAILKLEKARLEFEPWLAGDDSEPHPEHLTPGRPLTDPRRCNDIGQVYQGRVVLLTDAFTYSAADIFAAGFQDHEIGLILGKDEFTGGGGANVWNHSDLFTKLGPEPGIAIAGLPDGVSMRLAIRRCLRVGRNEGQPIEDLGVKASRPYVTNIVQDVIAGFPGMIREAAEMIGRDMVLFRVDVERFTPRSDGGVSVDVRSTNVTKLTFFLDGNFASEEAAMPSGTKDFVVPPVQGVTRPSRLRIEGRSGRGLPAGAKPVLVAVRNIALRESEAAAEADKEKFRDSRARANRSRRRR